MESVPKCTAVLGWRLEGDSSEQTQESSEMKNDVPKGSPVIFSPNTHKESRHLI